MLAPFAGQAFDDGAYGIPSVELINWYVETAPDRADRGYRLIPVAGLTQLTDPGNNEPIAGIGFADGFNVDGGLLVHSGTQLRNYGRDGMLQTVHRVTPSNGKTRFASSELDVVMGTGLRAYKIAQDTPIAQEIVLPNNRPIIDIAEIGQRHIYVEGRSGRLWYSEVADAAMIKADAFLTAEDEADELRAVRSFQGSLYLYGARSIQVLRPSGDEASPFYPSPAGTLPKGVIGRSAITIADFGQFFVGDDNIVYRLSGYQAQRISTHWIERRIQDLSFELRREVALTSYVWEGHTFLSLRLPNIGTYTYDAATQLWHRQKSYGIETSRRTAYREAWGKVYVGDAHGCVSFLDRGQGGEVGNPFPRIASTIIPIEDGAPDIANIVIEAQSGLGAIQGADTQPVIELRLSRDGHRWGDWQQGQLGKIGDFARKTVFGPFGKMNAPFFVLQVRYSGDLPITITALRLNQRRP